MHARAVQLQRQIDAHMGSVRSSAPVREHVLVASEAEYPISSAAEFARTSGGVMQARVQAAQANVGKGDMEEEEAVRKIEQGAKDLRRLLYRISRLERQQAVEEALRDEPSGALKLGNAQMQNEIESLRIRMIEADEEQEALESLLQVYTTIFI